MKTVLDLAVARYENKHSKFIAHLIPYTSFELTLKQLKKSHPKARHFVTAYRYVNTYAQIIEGSSDDGEPKSTSGKPSLAVLAGNDIVNAAVITVRYFGGVKLGTGGLVRAYTQAASEAVRQAVLSTYVPQVHEEFTCGYRQVSQVKYLLDFCGVAEVETFYESSEVRWNISAGVTTVESFFSKAGRLVERLGQ